MQNICLVVDTNTPSYSRAFLPNKPNSEERKWKSYAYGVSLPLLSSSSRFRCMTVHFFTSRLFVIGLLSKNSQILWIVSCPSIVLLLCERSTVRARVLSQCFARAGSQSVVLLSPPSLLLFQLPPSFSSSLSPSLLSLSYSLQSLQSIHGVVTGSKERDFGEEEDEWWASGCLVCDRRQLESSARVPARWLHEPFIGLPTLQRVPLRLRIQLDPTVQFISLVASSAGCPHNHTSLVFSTNPFGHFLILMWYYLKVWEII